MEPDVRLLSATALLLGIVVTSHLEGQADSSQSRPILRPRAALSGDSALDDSGRNVPIVLPPGAQVRRDVPYGPAVRQAMDVYIPKGAKNALVLVMVHGGAWMVGDKANGGVVAHKIAHWLPRGVIFVSVNYRMLPQAGPRTQAEDVARALAFVQAHAPEWGGDARRVVLMGHSAGAHLVALVAADSSLARSAGVKPWLGTVALDSACLDVPDTMSKPHFRFYDRVFGRDPAAWRAVSPVDRLSQAPRPMLLVCSTLRLESPAHARQFAAQVVRLGGKATVLPEALPHGDINGSLGLPGPYTDSVDAFLRSVGFF